MNQCSMFKHLVSTADSDSYLHCQPKPKMRKTTSTPNVNIQSGATSKNTATLERNNTAQTFNASRPMLMQEHLILNGKQAIAFNVPGDGNFLYIVSVWLYIPMISLLDFTGD